MISAAELRTLLSYDPATGLFVWIKSRGRAKAGASAGRLNKDGYVQIGRDYAHRLAFVYMTGDCPDLVDHIDQNKANNAWGNLRQASKSLNAINSKMRSTNASGATGVSWHSRGRKWQVHFGSRYLGLFTNKDDAQRAYLAACAEVAS